MRKETEKMMWKDNVERNVERKLQSNDTILARNEIRLGDK